MLLLSTGPSGHDISWRQKLTPRTREFLLKMFLTLNLEPLAGCFKAGKCTRHSKWCFRNTGAVIRGRDLVKFRPSAGRPGQNRWEWVLDLGKEWYTQVSEYKQNYKRITFPKASGLPDQIPWAEQDLNASRTQTCTRICLFPSPHSHSPSNGCFLSIGQSPYPACLSTQKQIICRENTCQIDFAQLLACSSCSARSINFIKFYNYWLFGNNK